MDWRIITQLQRGIQAHELAVFYVLACTFSWITWSLMMFGGNSSIAMVAAIVPALGPMVAAIITVKITGPSVQAWIRSLGPVRGGGQWYLAAALLVVALVATATGAYVVAGGQFTVPAVTVSALISAFVLTTTLGGGLEELGWRGYLLPRLQERLVSFWIALEALCLSIDNHYYPTADLSTAIGFFTE